MSLTIDLRRDVLKYAFVMALFVAVFSSVAIGQKVRLRSQITPPCTSQTSANLKFADIYAEGNIAVQGSYGCRGAFIYDITNPDAPVLAEHYNPIRTGTASTTEQFLEAIVVNGRGYFGSGNGGGVHIVNLADPYNPVLLGIVNSTNGGAYNSIHEMNVYGNYLIENLNSTTNVVIRIIDVSNPAAAVFKWNFDPDPEQVWVHAMHIRGNRLFTSGWGNSSNRGKTGIYEMTNLATAPPSLIGYLEDTSSITAGNNMHSAWTSEDGNYLYSCREVGNPDLRVYDIRDPSAPVLVNRIDMGDLGLNAIAPHNPVVKDGYLYIAWYQAGIQVFDLADPANPVRVGQYDTYQPAFAPPDNEKQTLADADPWDIVCASEFVQNNLPTSYEGNWAVYPFLGHDKVLAGDMKHGLLVLDASEIANAQDNRVSDFDGDGRTDLSVFRPESGDWEYEASANGRLINEHFGSRDDVIVPGDYDGDGETDLAVWRPSTGVWYLQRSTAGFAATNFGLNGDVPVAADYDADGRTDIAVWRPSTGIWYIQQSTLGFRAHQWGSNGDKVILGDFEGDGKTDLTVWRPSNGVWYVLQSSSTIGMYQHFGINGDKPVAADFDGNGITDYAIFRPSTGIWYILDPATRASKTFYFGISTDMPIPADYDGDSIADVAVFRATTNEWYWLKSSNGLVAVRTFGKAGDKPSPSSVQPQ